MIYLNYNKTDNFKNCIDATTTSLPAGIRKRNRKVWKINGEVFSWRGGLLVCYCVAANKIKAYEILKHFIDDYWNHNKNNSWTFVLLNQNIFNCIRLRVHTTLPWENFPFLFYCLSTTMCLLKICRLVKIMLQTTIINLQIHFLHRPRP